ncbi:MAG: RNA polymerase factor sigma-54 [Gemmatimonadetes bacterium]|nr:RNA polymerase factor sigma-54 [Gemmatimonadota bacterium]MYD25755.1 RNA polymerase factor sigma-54 [Gemmatimonadota bacterium]
MEFQLQPQTRQQFSPQLMYSLKLLQYTTLELEQEIKEKIEENPLLELEEEAGEAADAAGEAADAAGEEPDAAREDDPGDPASERDRIDWDAYIQDGMHNQMDAREETEKREDQHILEREGKSDTTLTEYLIEQLRLLDLSAQDREIGEYLIGNLNDSGLLDVPLLDLALESSVPFDEAERVLKVVQTLEPTGVGARDLRECLMLQLEALNLSDTLAYRLVSEHWRDVKLRRIASIRKKIRASEQEIGDALNVIAGLNPHPGLAVSDSSVIAIHPDLIVEKVDGEYLVYLNDRNLPRVRVSHAYQAILNRNAQSSEEDRHYVRRKLTEANHFVNSIEQRRSTLLKVTNCIVRAQREFLDAGLSGLKPMILQEVADEVGLHVTTVSRATQGKYVQTPRGIFALRFFFDGRLKKKADEETGEAAAGQLATKTVKDRIARIIEEEDARAPLSDQAIEEILRTKEGVQIKRRTVAKYRENLGIPIARMRRRI